MAVVSERYTLASELINRFYTNIENDGRIKIFDGPTYEICDDEEYERRGYDPTAEPTLIFNTETKEVFALFIDVSVIPEAEVQD